MTGVRLYLRTLQGGEPAVREAEPVDSEPALLRAFCEWMNEQRGTSGRTLYNYSTPIRQLLRRLGEDPSMSDASALRDFVLVYSRSTGWAGTKQCTTALRMFLRFLIAQGRCRAGLLGAIPVLAHWRLASLPRYLPAQDVERLIDSCEQTSPIGRRDRAIMLLLARLGLRAGGISNLAPADLQHAVALLACTGLRVSEAIRLRFDDMTPDGLVICATKFRKNRLVPLHDTARAGLERYLQQRRPYAPFEDHIFISLRRKPLPHSLNCCTN